MKKKLLIILTIFIFLSMFIFARAISSDNEGNTNSYNPDSAFGTSWNGKFHSVRIRIFRNNSLLSGMDKYFYITNTGGNCYTSIQANVCETTSYNYSNVTSTNGASCTNKTIYLGCITGDNLNSSWNVEKADGKPLQKHLEANNYSNLKSLLKDYFNYDDNNFNNSDVIVVEPATEVTCANKLYYGTITAMMKMNVSYRGKTGNLCSSNDNEYDGKNGGKVKGYTFNNAFPMIAKSFKLSSASDFSNSNYSGYGFFQYNVSSFNFERPPYTNEISHWAWGFKNHEGNNGGENGAFYLQNTEFSKKENETFTLNKDNGVNIPNGFYLADSFGTHWANGVWDIGWYTYNMGTTVTQISRTMAFEYDYNPISYNITYELDGGTNHSSNPAKYNVLYGVTFQEPTKEGYAFEGWYIGEQKVTGINVGANATFANANDLYSKLASRTTGDVTVKAKWRERLGNVEITKINSRGDKILNAQITFELYNDSSCTNVVNSKSTQTNLTCNTNGNGVCELVNIRPGTYYLKEIAISKNDYASDLSDEEKYFDANNECIQIVVEDQKTTKGSNYTNKTRCEVLFETRNVGKDPQKRMILYKDTGQKFNNLLNFQIESSKDACSFVEINDTQNLGCLSASITKTKYDETLNENVAIFNSSNLSAYDETIDLGNNVTAYCGLEYNLKNKLLSDNFEQPDNAVFEDFLAGQMFLKKNSNLIAQGVIEKTCYFTGTYNTSEMNEIKDKIYNNKTYSGYIESITFAGNILQPMYESYDDANKQHIQFGQTDYESASENYNVVIIDYFADYYLPKVYTHKGDGSITLVNPTINNKNITYEDINTGKDYIELGYGFASKLNEETSASYINIPFSIKIADGNIYDGSTGEKQARIDACKYKYNPVIVKEEKIDVEFRSVDTNNAFPGILGSFRNTRSNWCDGDNCDSNNDVVDSVLKDKVDSKNNCGAKYTIELSPEDIKAIRNYNSQTNYDDYNLECDDSGNNCNSSFISDLLNGKLTLQNDKTEVSLSNLYVDNDVPNLKSSCLYINGGNDLNFSLTFNPNGGSLSDPGFNLYNLSSDNRNEILVYENKVLVTYNSTKYSDMSKDIPKKVGYKFDGWYTSPTGGEKVYDANGIAIGDGTYFNSDKKWKYENNTILYAHWVNICELISGEENELGSKYACQVSNDKKYNFYVMSYNLDGTTNLIMEDNLNDGKVVQWNSNSIQDGPKTLLDKLHSLTSSWINVPNIIMNYTNEGQVHRNGGISKNISYFDIKTKGDNTELINTSINQTIEIYNNLKARVPFLSEIKGCPTLTSQANGDENLCNSWLTVNINKSGSSGGYWILSTYDNNPAQVWTLHNSYAPLNRIVNPYMSNATYNKSYSIRPVITLKLGDAPVDSELEDLTQNNIDELPKNEEPTIVLGPNQFTLKFDPNGGKIQTPGFNLYNLGNSGTWEDGNKGRYDVSGNVVVVTLNTQDYYNMSYDIPEKEGYKFKGWYTAKTDGTQVYDANGMAKGDGTYFDVNKFWIYQKNVNLYAQWEPICNLISGTAKQVGSKYECEVKEGTKFNFYVLSNESDRTNLIMEQNICSDGTAATKDKKCTVAWYYTDGQPDNSYGPVTAMTHLHSATKDWDNIPNIIINYSDEGKMYAGITTIYNKTKITKKDGTVTASYENLKARLPKKEELTNNGCTYDTNKEGCQDFLLNNINCGDAENSNTYWSLSSWNLNLTDKGSGEYDFYQGLIEEIYQTGEAYEIEHHCALDRGVVNVATYNGVRPVINIKLPS